MTTTNLIEVVQETQLEKLLFLGPPCIYQKIAEQPMSREALLTGPLQPTNEWYAIAQIMKRQTHRRQYGCDSISGTRTNTNGPNDIFDLYLPSVLPALKVKSEG